MFDISHADKDLLYTLATVLVRVYSPVLVSQLHVRSLMQFHSSYFGYFFRFGVNYGTLFHCRITR